VLKGTSILVLGTSGMLGSAVLRNLAQVTGWRVHGTQRRDPSASDYMDIADTPRQTWAGILLQQPYDYIVNCIGVLKGAVDERDTLSLRRTILVNALFPHELAAMAPNSHILHISTDGVFSGTLGRPYVETDGTDCSDVYGRTKALGECPAPNVINIRCSIIGRDALGGKGLIEWILRSSGDAELTGFEDEYWNGVTTVQFAELCRRIIESGSFDRIREVSGLHHFCPNPVTTKYDLLCSVRAAAGLTINIRRGRSGAASARILASDYSILREIYPDIPEWDAPLQDVFKTLQ
jgi:dTDP-4-dehydrorhamnose reductase